MRKLIDKLFTREDLAGMAVVTVCAIIILILKLITRC